MSTSEIRLHRVIDATPQVVWRVLTDIDRAGHDGKTDLTTTFTARVQNPSRSPG